MHVRSLRCVQVGASELKDEFQAQLDGAGAARAEYRVEGGVVRSGAAAAERARLRWIGEGPLAVSAGGPPGIGEIGVVEKVKGFHAELRPDSFPELKGFGNRKVHVAETGIAEDVATHVAKLAEAVRDQYGVADHVAITRGVQRVQCACAKRCGGGGARGWNGPGGASRAARTKARNAVRADGLEVGRIAEEIPTVGALVASAEVIVLIVDVPRLTRLQSDDGIELPSFQELGPGLFLRKRIGHGKRKAVANVFVAAGMFQQRMGAVLGKEGNPV